MNELATLVGPVWSEGRVSRALDASRDDVSARRGAGTLLGLVTSDGMLVYPVFQFHRRAEQVEVIPGLMLMMKTLRDFDGWTVAVLLNTPSPELGGSTPIEWAREGGEPETLRRLANVVAGEWGR